jgi:PelA/Pel-15E family pectate lyase
LQNHYDFQGSTTIDWKDALKQNREWYGSVEAVRIAENVMLYQRNSGGWPKNINMAALLTPEDKKSLLDKKAETDSTIDNNATYTQLAFLARVYQATKNEAEQQAFLKGVDYLLQAQYPNGGWPQYYPQLTGYFKRITFNDNAMIGVMTLLRDIASAKRPYEFVDERRRKQASAAVQKGLECILKTQVVVDGQLTVWGAQHDEKTLAPAAARTFEPVSLVSGESVGIVRFLMAMDRPQARVMRAVEAAISWFEKTKISGVKWIEESTANGMNRRLIKDERGGPVWARFYEIGTNRPIFAGRDSVIKYDVSQIEAERRNGYQWYVTSPAQLLNDYVSWKKRMKG